MRVFPDANVWISGIVSRGTCAEVLYVANDEHELLATESILGEVLRVLDKKFEVSSQKLAQAHTYVGQYIFDVPDTPVAAPVVRDPDDQVVLESALRLSADVLVTGDRDLLDIAALVEGLRICTPRQFLDEIHSQ